MKTLFIYLSLIALLLPRCISRPNQEIYSDYDRAVVPFEFESPDLTWKLPHELREISGLTSSAPDRLAVIEDEHGTLFLLDVVLQEIIDEVDFGKHADYEGIESIGETYYAIESNGDLHEFSAAGKDSKKTETLFGKKNNVEGLGALNSNLLVACKADGSVGKFKTKHKGIYQLNPHNLDVQLLFAISIGEMKNILKDKNREGKIREFDPSGIAFDEINKHIYIISADHLLVVTDLEGGILEVVFLDPAVFRQPEGICFDAKGTLYLSSEGAGKKGRIFRFSRI